MRKLSALVISNVFWSLILFLLFYLSLNFAFISPDAPYYLSVAEDISEGLVPYRDIYIIYTPLMMYVNSLLFLLMENPDYQSFLLLQYLFIFLSAIFLFLICRKFQVGKGGSLFLSLLLFLSVLSSEGTFIILEIYLICCVFISFFLLMRRRFFLVGIFLTLSFLFKQYGIINYLIFFLLIWALYGLQKKIIFRFLAGVIVPLFAFFFYFLMMESISFGHLIEQISGGGYGEKNITAPPSLFGFISGGKVFLLLLLPLFYLRLNLFKNRINLILALGILFNLIPVFIQNFAHYFILTFPFVFILFARNYSNFNRRFFWIANLVLLLVSTLLFLRIIRYKDVYSEQLKIAEMYREKYPLSSEVFLLGEIRFLYILNDYTNPVLSEIGYSYEFIPDDNFRKKYNVLKNGRELGQKLIDWRSNLRK